MFGARGDGLTNDTDPINAAGLFLEAQGGGTIAFSQKTYIVGRQSVAAGIRAWDIVAIRRCPRKVTVAGQGAKLRAAPGLRFGSFDPGTGRPAAVKMPFSDPAFMATPFRAAILLVSNRGGVEVRDLEIDGAIAEAMIGGQWGDTGWQIPNHGIELDSNQGEHVVRNVRVRNMGCDGAMIRADVPAGAERAASVLVEDCRMERNGRQGLSLISGRNATFRRCAFLYTGRNGVVRSSPGAGFDIEAELAPVSNVSFVDCVFDANTGTGLGADSGDTAGVTCLRCRFIGAYNFALWPNKPDMVFRDCLIVGAAAGFYSDPSGRHGPQFHHCRFTDAASLGLTGQLYDAIVELGASKGVLFDDCDFTYAKMPLPNTQAGTVFNNCRLSSPAPGKAQLNGTFTGTNVINGGADLSVSTVKGRLIHNGKPV